MKKETFISLLLTTLFLSSCVSSSNTQSSQTTTDSVSNDSEVTDSGDTDHSLEVEENPWSDEQIELFNQYLGGYILPTFPNKVTSFRYFIDALEIKSNYEEGIGEKYTEKLIKDGFECNYDETYKVYSARKTLNEEQFIFLSYLEDTEDGENSFILYPYLRNFPKDREHAWTNEELKLFSDYFEGEVLPFPETSSVGIRYQKNSGDNYLHIIGNYSDTVLSSYLTAISLKGYELSTHPTYGIDVAKKKIDDKRYFELWIAIADETSAGGGMFFEVLARVRFGLFNPDPKKYVNFGEYPQTEVGTRSYLYDELSALVGTLPEEGKPGNWEVYDDCYAEYVRQEYTFYKDIEYRGAKYRAMYSTNPRTFYTGSKTNYYEEPYTVNDNGYRALELFFFKFEPITWEIFDNKDGVKLLAPTKMLDVNYFTVKEDHYTLDGKEIYLTNYEHSFIRSWINNEFYDLAFDSNEKEKIQVTHVDNSLETVLESHTESNLDSLDYMQYDYHDYISNDLDDKVFLFTRKDLIDYDFGYGDFENWQHIDYNKSVKLATEYALARGALRNYSFHDTIYYGSVKFYLRTPLLSSYRGDLIFISDESSGLAYSYTTPGQTLGVYPAINVKF